MTTTYDGPNRGALFRNKYRHKGAGVCGLLRARSISVEANIPSSAGSAPRRTVSNSCAYSRKTKTRDDGPAGSQVRATSTTRSVFKKRTTTSETDGDR